MLLKFSCVSVSCGALNQKRTWKKLKESFSEFSQEHNVNNKVNWMIYYCKKLAYMGTQ